MADDKTTQAQQNPFFPFALPTTPFFGADLWKQAADAWLGRMTALTEEATKVEAMGAERARAAIDESARLARESLSYSLNLSAEWRKMMLDMTRQAMATGQPKV